MTPAAGKGGVDLARFTGTPDDFDFAGAVTPIRHAEVATFAEHDVSDEPRDKAGRWTAGGAAAPGGAEENAAKAADAKAEAPQRPFATKKQADAWLAANVKASGEPSKDEAKTLREYKVADYRNINATLRGQPLADTHPTGDITQKVRHLDAVLARSTVTKSVIVQRGVTTVRWPGAEQFFTDNVGRTVHDAGFLSTTVNSKTAETFGGQGFRGGILCEIHVPAGSKGAHLKGMGESELLLARGCELHIDSITDHPRGGKLVKMTLVGQGGEAARAHAEAPADDDGSADADRFLWREGDLVPLPEPDEDEDEDERDTP